MNQAFSARAHAQHPHHKYDAISSQNGCMTGRWCIKAQTQDSIQHVHCCKITGYSTLPSLPKLMWHAVVARQHTDTHRQRRRASQFLLRLLSGDEGNNVSTLE